MSNQQSPPAGAQGQRVETAQGRDLTITFDAKRCIHARYCVLGQPGVFKANAVGAWIAPDEATSTEALIAVAQNCPSGAIQYRRKDGGPEEQPPAVNLIQLRENGPLSFRGELVMYGLAGSYRATLCRCGQSQNKPYCDGAHRSAGFTATGEPADGDVEPLATRDGPLAIKPLPNGPLAVSGNMELLSGTGRTIGKAQTAMMCRCGASQNKPYCDGSHARVEFRG